MFSENVEFVVERSIHHKFLGTRLQCKLCGVMEMDQRLRDRCSDVAFQCAQTTNELFVIFPAQQCNILSRACPYLDEVVIVTEGRSLIAEMPDPAHDWVFSRVI